MSQPNSEIRIAVAAEGRDKTSSLSMTAGRAPFYLIFQAGKLQEVIKNPFRFGGGGAGYGVAQLLADKKVKLVIAGQFGANMVGALQGYGIEYQEISAGRIEEIIQNLAV